jgi:hypothetical protein
MERSDLQLITTKNPSDVPEWVAHFNSTQLISVLAAAIPPSQRGNWWFAPFSSTLTPGQLLLLAPDQAEAVAQQGSYPDSPDDSSKRKKRKLAPMFVSSKHIPLTEFPYNFANL